jgi:hypothetical protein
LHLDRNHTATIHRFHQCLVVALARVGRGTCDGIGQMD